MAGQFHIRSRGLPGHLADVSHVAGELRPPPRDRQLAAQLRRELDEPAWSFLSTSQSRSVGRCSCLVGWWVGGGCVGSWVGGSVLALLGSRQLGEVESVPAHSECDGGWVITPQMLRLLPREN